MTGVYGGGAFVLIYLLCVGLIGIPIMMAEIMLGRRGRQSPINTMYTLAIESGQGSHWKFLGWIGVIAGLLILSFYSVIAGWTVAYVYNTVQGTFIGMSAKDVESVFSDFISSPGILILWHTVFMVLTVSVVSRGVRGGLELAVKYLMPTLFILLLVLVGYSMNTGEFAQGVKFLFSPDFDKISTEGILAAMGQAFFSLSLGMGAIMVYGSYLPQHASIAKATFTIALADTLVALLAGLAIFPIVFANGLVPGEGPGLVFVSLPLAFGQMTGGTFFGTLFFVLLVFAAWTSAISLIEPGVAYLVESKGLTRRTATIGIGVTAWFLGLLTVFSFNIWSDVHPLSMFDAFSDKTFFDLIDYLTSNILLPLGGLLIAIFAVWFMSHEASREELALDNERAYALWRFLARYVTPIGVVIIFLKAVKLI